MLKDLAHGQFAQHLHQTFRIRLDSLTLDVELIEADTLASVDPGGQRRQAFSLVFRGPKEPILPQGTYRFEHTGMGTLDIFIVPIGSDPQGFRYEAVFT